MGFHASLPARSRDGRLRARREVKDLTLSIKEGPVKQEPESDTLEGPDHTINDGLEVKSSLL